MLGQLVEFMDGARTAARALFTTSDVAEGGYRLGPARVRRNAAFCVPLLAYFHDAFERRSFWILGRRFSFPFLGHFRRRTSGPKRLRAPELTLVPRRTGNFITLPAGIFMRVLAEAAEVCRDTVALRRLTCLLSQVRGALPRVLREDANVVALCDFMHSPHRSGSINAAKARAVTTPLFRRSGNALVAPRRLIGAQASAVR